MQGLSDVANEMDEELQGLGLIRVAQGALLDPIGLMQKVITVSRAARAPSKMRTHVVATEPQ